MQKQKQTISLSDIRSVYKLYAPIYDRIFGGILADGRKKALAIISASQPKSILEMGVGTGLLLEHYPRNANVVGVDICSDMLISANKKIERHRLSNTTVMNADCESLNFQDNSFECIVLPYILSVTPNPEKLIAESIRLCHPKGHIVIVNHFSGSWSWSLFEKILSPLSKRMGFRSKFSYSHILGCNQWKVISCTNANFLGLSKVLLICPNKQ
jgi:phosphatidylethanolamine/phosphatidyl-N-methylethanolamine N-methyltransferase